MIKPILEHRLIDGLREFADSYDVILCDVWGVVHDGVRVFAPATDALGRFRARGGTVVLITNAPRPARPILHQLDALGAPRGAFDAVVTSGDVTLALMAARDSAPLHHIGPKRDLSLLDEFEAMASVPPRRVALDMAAYVLCTGLYDDESETPEDYDLALAAMAARGLTMICANPDLVVHRGEKLLYCAGALAARYEARGGPTLYAGKPHPTIYGKALEQAAAVRGGSVDRSRVLAIGDAMHTDIAGAVGFGLDALFVTSGIHRGELHDTDGRLNRARYAQFAGDASVVPAAAIADLVW